MWQEKTGLQELLLSSIHVSTQKIKHVGKQSSYAETRPYLFYFILHVFISVCVFMCARVLMPWCIWRSEDNFYELVLSCHVGFGDQLWYLGSVVSTITH